MTEKQNWSIEDIERLIKDKTEESLNLEFKSSGALAKNDKSKTEISKDISAMANANGGIIVYGINEKEHVAKEIPFINGNEFTKEWFEQVIGDNIHPKVDMIIHPIRQNDDISKSIYVIEIPESEDSPHMAKDNRYYERYNFKIQPMEEYKVRRLYHQAQKTKLRITDVFTIPLKGYQKYIEFNIRIKNIGNRLERFYKLIIDAPVNQFIFPDVSENVQSDKLSSFTNYSKENRTMTFSFSKQFAIYPNEEIIFNTVRYKNTDLALLNSKDIDSDLIIKLMYSSGKDGINASLIELYNKHINS